MSSTIPSSRVQTSLPERLRARLAGWELGPGRIVVALSGGPDSVALLRGLIPLRDEPGWDVTAAHLNHRLRGTSADDDEQFVRALCEQLGVHLDVELSDVTAAAAEARTGIEEAARNRRYAFLARTAAMRGAAYVATGHTADDQAETVLHRILRGTGLPGLAGMPQRRLLKGQGTGDGRQESGARGQEAESGTGCSVHGTELSRPLLNVSRREVLEYLEQLGQPFVTDATNDHLHVTRNRLRHDLLPKLAGEYNPQVRDALLRLARQAGESQEIVDAAAEQLLDQALCQRTPHRCTLDTRPLSGQPRHLVRACFVRLWQQQRWPMQAMGYDHWDRLADLAIGGQTKEKVESHAVRSLPHSTRTKTAVTLPGAVDARRRRALLIISISGSESGAPAGISEDRRP